MLTVFSTASSFNRHRQGRTSSNLNDSIVRIDKTVTRIQNIKDENLDIYTLKNFFEVLNSDIDNALYALAQHLQSQTDTKHLEDFYNEFQKSYTTLKRAVVGHIEKMHNKQDSDQSVISYMVQVSDRFLQIVDSVLQMTYQSPQEAKVLLNSILAIGEELRGHQVSTENAVRNINVTKGRLFSALEKGANSLNAILAEENKGDTLVSNASALDSFASPSASLVKYDDEILKKNIKTAAQRTESIATAQSQLDLLPIKIRSHVQNYLDSPSKHKSYVIRNFSTNITNELLNYVAQVEMYIQQTNMITFVIDSCRCVLSILNKLYNEIKKNKLTIKADTEKDKILELELTTLLSNILGLTQRIKNILAQNESDKACIESRKSEQTTVESATVEILSDEGK